MHQAAPAKFIVPLCRKRFVFISATLLSILPVCHGEPADHAFALSAKRLGIVRAVVDNLVAKQGFADLSDADAYDIVAVGVMDAKIGCTLRPVGELVTMAECRKRVRERAETEAAAEFPAASETWWKQAAEKYPILKEGETVRILFMPNPARSVVVEGVYQGFDGKNLIIDRQRYQLESLKLVMPEADDLSLLIDQEANAARRREFVEDEQRELLRKRSDFIDQKVADYGREEIARAIASNEANGYIFVGRNWYSLKDVITKEIADRRLAWEKERQRLAEEEAARAAAAANPEPPPDAPRTGDLPDGNDNPPAPGAPGEPLPPHIPGLFIPVPPTE